MRIPLSELAHLLHTEGEAAIADRYGTAFLVADPSSAFNLPSGPMETMRVDRSAFIASSRGEFHPTSPSYPLQRRADSVYSFISIGRTENCDICLPDDTVSKLHALVRERKGEFSVQDADSANGSFRGEDRIPGRHEGEPLRLASGDVVRFGQIKLHFLKLPELVKLLDDVVPRGPDLD